MKKTKYYFAIFAMLALLCTSCSEEQTHLTNEDQEKIQVTFTSLLNDMTNDLNKQATPGACREGDPSYVLVGITDENGNYIGDDGGTSEINLVEVGLKWNSSMNVYETVYSEELALPAGDYQLEYFIVYDTEGEALWVAPRTEGTFGEFVGNALPQDIVLLEGTKPYITVDVLCYIPRNEDAYGYVFFDINLTEVENGYCLFVNYCDDETGREYPAYFSVQVWADAIDGEEEITLSNNTNSITMEGGWPSASVLCFALPPLGDDTYYARVTVLNHDDLGYTADESDIHEFEITQADIDAQELFIPAYDHVRINCAPDGDPGGGGDVGCNTDIICGLNLENELPLNCAYTSLEGTDEAGYVEITEDSQLALMADTGASGFINLATADISLTGGEIYITLDTPIDESDRITAYTIEIRRSTGGQIDTTCWESLCANVVSEYGEIANEFDGFTYDYPFYVKINTINCFSPELLD